MALMTKNSSLKNGAAIFSKHEKTQGKIFDFLLVFSSILVLLILIGAFVTLTVTSIPAIKKFGFSFLSGTTWDPVFDHFGAYPFILGTLLTSILALLISYPFSMALGILLSEYVKDGPIAGFFISATELLAGIPSVIYGFWGLFFLVPIVRKLEMTLGLPPFGIGILSASLILSIMIIPYAASLVRESIKLVPHDLKEASYALGATKLETIKNVILPYARSGTFAGFILSFGRALGETMAVTMLIGNSNMIPHNIFAPANTIASAIANEFAEASGGVYVSALIELGLVLFVLTTIFNVTGRYVIKKMSIEGN